MPCVTTHFLRQCPWFLEGNTSRVYELLIRLNWIKLLKLDMCPICTKRFLKQWLILCELNTCISSYSGNSFKVPELLKMFLLWNLPYKLTVPGTTALVIWIVTPLKSSWSRHVAYKLKKEMALVPLVAMQPTFLTSWKVPVLWTKQWFCQP